MWNISFIPGQYSNSFIVFVFAAVLLLMRVHLSHKEAEWDRNGVKYPEFISLPVLNATFWVAVVLLLLASWLPLAERSETASERWANFTAPVTERLTPLARVFISVNAKKPISVHNLDDALPLQGKIKLNSNEAVDIDVEITPEMAAFLRAQSFDEYTSSGWKLNVESDVPLAAGERPEVAPAVEGSRQEVTINVTVKGNGDETVYSLGQPLQADVDADARTGADGTDITGLRPDGRLHEGDQYSVTGSVAVPSIEQLQAAGQDYPDWVEDRYLALPGSVPERVYGKAAQVTRGAQTPFEAALAIEGYLRSFPNDFDVSSTPPGRDSVDYFLFDLQRGYFDYHASAMAVMLRTLGIPARVATGYAVDPIAKDDPAGTHYKLTERNAFAWPEVYFPGIGWVEFSPTPSQPVIRRPGFTRVNPADPSERGLEDPSTGEDELGFADLGDQDDVTPDDDASSAADDEGGSGSWPVMLSLIVIGAVVATGALGARFAWEFGLGGLPRPVQLWEKTQRLARLARFGAKPSDTPREFATRLRDNVPGTDAASYMAAQYERARFGQKQLSEEETERLESAWSSVRNQLLRRIFRPRRD
jgi:transglutaminase-like putative cysteine protease